MFSQFILIFVWIGAFAIFAKYGEFNTTVTIDGVKEIRYKWLFAFVAMLPLVFMTAYRDSNYGDTIPYMLQFGKAPEEMSGLSDFIDSREKDKGFYVFMSLVKIYITKDVRVFFLIVAFLQVIVLVSVYRYYSPKYVFSVFLFIISTDYLTWMFNGARQFIAALFIFAATPFLIKKKYFLLLCIIALASTFHQSALIMIPMIFVVQGEAWNKKTLLFILMVIMAIVFVNSFTDFMDSSLQDTQYSNMVSDYTSWEDNGTNPLRVMVYSVPTIFALYGRKKLQEENNRLLNLCINMSIISSGLYIVSMFTSGIFLGRLPIYFSLFNYILLPWEIDIVFEEDMKKTINIVAIAFYSVFYIYQVFFVWKMV